MEYWTKDQLKMPKLAFGTYKLKPEEAVLAVQQALKFGLRHIDTAQIYQTETQVGKAIKESSIPRESIFLTTKIWRDFLKAKEVKKTFQDSLDRLRTDYIDLLLIHWPNPKIPLEETLGAFKDLKKANKVRFIGVSNFTCKLLRRARSICPELITNQVEYHPLLSQSKMLDFIADQKMFLTAYCPLIRGKVFKIQQLLHLAEKYKKTPCQISLRWLVEQKNVIPVFKSSHKDHIKENVDIFNFELKDEDKEQIFRLSKNKQRIINPPFAPLWDK